MLALLFAPTLSQPFDFEDDGNLVYCPSAGDFAARIAHIAERTSADFSRRGPFRPLYWAYFELNHYCFGTDPAGWRLTRSAVLMLTAVLWVALLRELGIAPWAAAAATVLGLAAPLRAGLWYRLGFGEGMALPCMLLALLAACRARRSPRWFLWDLLAALALLAAVLTKNVFIAAAPALFCVRFFPETGTWRESFRRHWPGAIPVLMVALVPLVHLAAFTTLVAHQSEYTVAAPGWRQAGWMARSTILSAGGEFLGAGLVLAFLGILLVPETRRALAKQTQALLAGALLLIGGIAVYLPALGETRPAGRYTLPAACGGDLWLAVLFSCLPAIAVPWLRRGAWLLLSGGAAAMLIVGLHQQLEFIGRSEALAQVCRWLQEQAPPASEVRVVAEGLSKGESVHLQAHLAGAGRTDVAVVAAEEEDRAACATLVLTSATAPAPAGRALAARFEHPFGHWLGLAGAPRKRGGGVALWRAAEASTVASPIVGAAPNPQGSTAATARGAVR